MVIWVTVHESIMAMYIYKLYAKLNYLLQWSYERLRHGKLHSWWFLSVEYGLTWKMTINVCIERMPLLLFVGLTTKIKSTIYFDCVTQLKSTSSRRHALYARQGTR